MMNEQIFEGNWNEIKGKLLEKWGQLTDDDVQRIRGDVEQLIGVIQLKTGEARQAIEQYLHEISHNAACTARGYARHAADQIHAGCDKVEHVVRDRPGQSMLVCFGAGLIAGVAIALSLRSR
jgi:uncharacterized protein YjbJ (UPF0337 family)